jgi:hypothetical protein
MNRELVEGTAVISSLNVTFTYPTAQLKDLISQKNLQIHDISMLCFCLSTECIDVLGFN